MKIQDALSRIPVAINCYYGDPAIQWKDTVAKIATLARYGHAGPVVIITKGIIGKDRAKELASFGLPNLIVMVSVSELPKEFENIGHAHRYTAIRNCLEAGIKCFAAVRPLTPPHNTSPEIITRIMRNLHEVGCEIACVSGFRGDESLVAAMRPDQKINWVLRVKQMTGFDQVLRLANENQIKIFTRVSCAVAVLTGAKNVINPYWGSPQLVRCNAIACPITETCGPVTPDEELLSWLRGVGYELEWQPSPKNTCSFSSDTRLNCQSCCTTCFVQKQPRVLVHNAETLGDLTFCRFILGGTLCVKPGMVDGGAKDVASVKILNQKIQTNIQCLNSWWVWARQLKHCLGCTYCISSLYPNSDLVGCAPESILNILK